jgi:hypothetical protein
VISFVFKAAAKIALPKLLPGAKFKLFFSLVRFNDRINLTIGVRAFRGILDLV